MSGDPPRRRDRSLRDRLRRATKGDGRYVDGPSTTVPRWPASTTPPTVPFRYPPFDDGDDGDDSDDGDGVGAKTE